MWLKILFISKKKANVMQRAKIVDGFFFLGQPLII